MIRSANYKERTLTVPPNDVRTYDALGNTFGCLEATAFFHIKFGNEGSATQFRKGLKMRTETAFERVTIENRSDVPLTVTVYISMGDVDDARLVLPEQLIVRRETPAHTTIRKMALGNAGNTADITYIDPAENQVSVEIRVLTGTLRVSDIWPYSSVFPGNFIEVSAGDPPLKFETTQRLYISHNYVGPHLLEWLVVVNRYAS